MSCHRHAARPKQHYFLLACQSGTFFENNAAKPTIKSRFSSDSRLERAPVSAPATVSFCSPMLFSNGIFYQKFQSKKQRSAKKRQSHFPAPICLAQLTQQQIWNLFQANFSWRKISKSRFQIALLLNKKMPFRCKLPNMTFLQPLTNKTIL